MANDEYYYLLLVLGAFGAFSIAMLTATIQDRAYARRSKTTRR